MQTLEDRQSIADLMIGWIHRDLAEWDKLRALFHPDGTIEISWFEGLASDFVDGWVAGAIERHGRIGRGLGDRTPRERAHPRERQCDMA